MTGRWCLGLLMLSLAISYLSHETEAQGRGIFLQLAPIGKVIYRVYTVAGQVMSLTSWATGGCIYFPSICDLKDSIAMKEPEAVELSARLTDSSQRVYTLYDENVDLWNMLNLANIRNERVIGQIEMLEDVANDIINRLDLSTDIFVIDPEDIDNDPNIIDQSLDTITTEIEELNQALWEKKVRDGIPLGISTTGSAIFYGYQMYSYYRYVTYTPNTQHAQVLQRRNAVMVHSYDLQDFQIRMVNIQTYFDARPRLVRVISAAYYGISALMGGITLALDVQNANRLRQDLERIDSDLDYIIDQNTDTTNTLSTLLDEQRQINAELIQMSEDIKEVFLASTRYLERVRLGTTAASHPELWTLPTYTTDNVNVDNLLDSITVYNDWLIGLREEHIAIDNRLQAVTMVEDMVEQYTGLPVFLIVTIAQLFDETITRDAVLATIADKMPDASTWPDMTGPVQLAPHRGL